MINATKKFPLLAAFILAGTLIFTPVAASAEKKIALPKKTPTATVQEIFNKMVEKKSAVPILDYIAWNEAFNGLKDRDKKRMDVKSPDQLKTFYKGLFTDAGAFMKTRMQHAMKEQNIPKEHLPMIEQVMEQAAGELRQKSNERNAKIANSKLKVLKEKIEGEKAMVDVAITNPDKSQRKEEIELIVRKNAKKELVWLLPRLQILDRETPGDKKAPAAPTSTPVTPAPAPMATP